jgi:hypothetical protein
MHKLDQLLELVLLQGETLHFLWPTIQLHRLTPSNHQLELNNNNHNFPLLGTTHHPRR